MIKARRKKSRFDFSFFVLILYAIALAFGAWNPLASSYTMEDASDSAFSPLQLLLLAITIYWLVFAPKVVVNYPYKKSILFFFIFLTGSTIIQSINTLTVSSALFLVKLGLGISIIYSLPKHYYHKKEEVYYALLAFAVGASVIAVCAWSGFLGRAVENMGGRFLLFGENPNSTGGRLALAIFILLYIVIENPLYLGKWRWLLLLPIPSDAVLMLAGGSRGALVILAISVMVFLWFTPKVKRVAKIGLIISGIAIAIGGYRYILTKNRDFAIGDRMESTIASGDNTGRGRLNDMTLEIFISGNVLIGPGTQNYRELMMSNYGESRVSHNLYIYLLGVGGISGFILFGLFLLGLLKRSWHYVRTSSMPLVLFIFMFLLAYKTGGVITYLLMWFVFGTIVTLTYLPFNSYTNDGK